MKKPIITFLIPAMFLTPPAMAIDFSKFEATCEEIGFKQKTEAFGDCVLELAGRAKKADAQKAQLQAQEEQRRQYENQRQREVAVLRQQQEQQVYQLQQQQLAAQRQQENRENVDAFLGVMGLLSGAASGYAASRKPVQTYQPPVQVPKNCTSYVNGNIVNTNCW